MKKHTCTLMVAAALALSACSTPNSLTQKQEVIHMQGTEEAKVTHLVEAYFDESLALSPLSATFVGENKYNHEFDAPLSAESLANSQALEEKYLNAINQIDKSALSGQALINYEIFKREREMSQKALAFPSHYLPMNQMYGVHNFYPMLGSGQSAQPFNTVEDYENFLKRSKGFVAYMDSQIAMMREGMAKGVTQSKVLMKKVLPQLQAHLVTDPEQSVFYGPVGMLAEKDFSQDDKQRLTQAYTRMIMQELVPAYQRMADFIEHDYLPNARESHGLSGLPNGKAWYDHMIETHTTLPLSAKEIHEFGLSEVARIRSEMEKVKQTVGFEGDLAAFFKFLQQDDQFYFDSPEAVVEGYESVKDKINARLPQLFEVFPKADYEVKPVEAFRAASSAGASYQGPAPDGSRPGIFYINTHNLKAQPKFLMETLSIHEAAPGHHFQIAIQQEVDSLPRFRKFGTFTVFAEGWALYAESLGKELGLFTDPYMWYGRLVDEQLRAMRLVVDTGLHAFGWTREQAMAFMQENSSMADSDIESEVERYMAIPGQALAYKTGQRAIRDLRTEGEAHLGDKFDVRKFHTQVLIDGSMPMPVLQRKMRAWFNAQH